MVDFLGSTILDVIIILVAFVILDWASNLTINNAVKVSTITRLGKTAIGFTLIAFSTSLPELTVATIAAFSGGAGISIGNVLGSNIINISVVVGAASIIVYFRTRRKAKKNNETNIVKSNLVKSLAKSELGSIYFSLFISSIIPVVLIFVSTAAWLVGIALIAIFVGYMYQLTKVRIPEEESEPVTADEKKHLKKDVLSTIFGAIVVVVSAYFIVESAVNVAGAAGLSQQVIGATVIAFGTSLPELTLDLKAILKGHAGLAFGDIIGSSFVNITLILGISLLVPTLLGTPVELTITTFQNLVLFSIVTNLLFWYFLSRGQIGHKEGLVFLFIYAVFVVTTIGTM